MKAEAGHPIIRNSTPVRVFDNLGEIVAVAVLPDRRRMATNSKDGMLRLWDLKNGVMVKEMEGRGEAMRDMALSRDGKFIAASDESGYVNVWHGDTGSLTQAFRAHSYVCSLDFSPDGATLATGAYDYAVKLWSTLTQTWQLQGEKMDCDYQVNCVRYSPSGEFLAIATSCTIDIRNTATKQRIISLTFASVSLVWTPDGTQLLSGGGVTIQGWDSATWKPVGDIWKGDTGHRWHFAVNCNGTLVASPTTDNHVRIWRLSDRRTIAIFQSDSPYCITFSMDGKHILAGGKDGKISEWAVPEYAWPEDIVQDQAAHSSSHLCGANFIRKNPGGYKVLQTATNRYMSPGSAYSQM
jgi:WD40 repeat protein